MPEVTVVVPTRDRRDLVRRALDSVLSQRDVDLEVVVVDDGSTDGTPELLAGLPVRTIRHEHSRGVAAARNAGIAAAEGQWVAFLDDDDLWAPGKLRAQLDAVPADAGMSYTGQVVVDGDLRPVELWPAADPERLPDELRETNSVGGPSTVAVRTDLLRELGGFDERLAVLADWELWWRVTHTTRAAAHDEPLVAYAAHADNMHVERTHDVIRERRLISRKHGVRIGGEEFWDWIVHGHRRAGRRMAAARAYLWLGLRYGRPRDVARGLAMPFGERVMALGRQDVEPDPVPEPEWLRRYR